jgi:hypothetical protein
MALSPRQAEEEERRRLEKRRRELKDEADTTRARTEEAAANDQRRREYQALDQMDFSRLKPQGVQYRDGWENGEEVLPGGDYERRVVPGVDDPVRDEIGFGGPNNWSPAMLQPAAPEGQDGGIGMGSGGPGGEGGLSDQQIIDIRDRLRIRKEGESSRELRARMLNVPNPDQAAMDAELAERHGVNRLEVERNRDTFTAVDRAQSIDALRKTAPKLRDWLDHNPVHLEIAYDDVEHLEWWEHVGKFGGDVGGSLGAGYFRVSSGLAGVMRAPGDLVDTNSDWSKYWAGIQKTADWQAESLRPDVIDPTMRGVHQGFESLPMSGAAIMMAMMGRPDAAIGMMGGVTGGQSYGEARDQGLDPVRSLAYGANMGLIETATEKLPMGWLVGDLAKKTPFVEMLMRQTLAEAPTEQVATHAQDFLAWAVLPENATKTIDDYIAARGPAAYETLVASLVGSGVQTTMAKAVDETLRATNEDYLKRQDEELARTIAALGDAGKDSKLLKRLPDKYREAVAEITKGGARENVYINPEAMRSLAQSTGKTTDELAQAFRIDPADMNTAMDTGEFIAVPVGNYAAAIQTAKKDIGVAGTAIHTALQDDLKYGNDDKSFTRNELKEEQALWAMEAEARANARETIEGFADSADRVRAGIREQITATGVFNADSANTQADLLGAMVETLAIKTNQDPEALWKDQGFDIVASLNGEPTEADALAQSMGRKANPPGDVELEFASKELPPQEFEAWKGARDGLSNEQIAERMNEVEPDAVVSADDVKRWLFRSRERGYDSQKTHISERGLAPGTQRLIELRARGVKNPAIAAALYPDVDTPTALNRVKTLASKNKALIEERRAQLEGSRSLAQSKLPMDEGARMERARSHVAAALAAKGVKGDRTRAANTPSDDELLRASEALTDTEFQAWKAAREGRSNDAIADIVSSENRIVTPENVSVVLAHAKAKGFEVGSGAVGRRSSPELARVLELRLAGLSNPQIAARVFPDRDLQKARALVAQWSSEHKDILTSFASQEGSSKLLAQNERGTFTPRADRNVVRLFATANLSTLAHEGSHWYLDTLWRMSKTENPHPFVLEQLAAILEWQGKSPNWDAMFNPDGSFTKEGVEVQEAFAETFEAYLMEGRAPTTALRSVFASFKQWLLNIYKGLVSRIGGRVRINDEIRQVFDRMLATDEAIKAVHTGLARDGEAMAKAIMEKQDLDGKWSPERKEKFLTRMRERYAAARERAEAALMARLMDEFQRTKQAAWNDEERQVRLEVQAEVDARPEQRAYAWLAGSGWRETAEDRIANEAASEAEAMRALAQAPELGFFEANATDASIQALQAKMVENGIIPVVLLFRTTSGRVIAFPGDSGNFGMHHDMAREVFGLGDLKLQHGVWNPRKWPTIEAMNAADTAWYDTSGTAEDAEAPAPVRELAQRTTSTDRHWKDVSRVVEFLRTNPAFADGPLAKIMTETQTAAYAADRGRKLYRKDRSLAQISDGGVSTLRAFIESPDRNAHLAIDNYEVYLRKSLRPDSDGLMIDAIDLVSVTRTDAENASFSKGRAPDEKPGDFRDLVKKLESEAADHGIEAVYVESVMNEFLPDVLVRYGYSEVPGGDLPSFIKRVGKTWTNYALDLEEDSPSLAQSVQPSRSLVVIHNLTEQNLFHVEEIGGLAAPSLAVVDTDKGVLNNFGGITLVAEPDFLSTSKVRTFDADIYSPRHPRPLYDINDKAASALVKELREATKDWGDLRDIDLDALHKDGPSSLIRNDMVKAAFFASRGELPKRLPRKEIPNADEATKAAARLPIMASDQRWQIREDSEVIRLATEHYQAVGDAIRSEDPELAAKWDDRFFYEQDGQRKIELAYLDRFITDVNIYRRAANREVDTIELGSMLSKKLRDKKTEAAFEQYVEALAARVITGKSLFKGFTNAGNRRYGDYTMETILREMTQDIQGGENWHYGAGSVRATYANELKSLSAIRARKGQLVSEEEMKAAKDEGQNALLEILEYLKPYYRFGGGNQFMQMDDMSKALMEGPKGIREAFDFKGDPEPQTRIREFIDLLTDLPTEYFEAKAGRAVDLSEFTAAIVPRGTSERALEILRKAGLQIRFYARDNAADRTRAVRGVSSALFQTGDSKGRTAPPPNLPPMRLNLQAVRDQYGDQALAEIPPEVAAFSAEASDVEQFVQIARDVRKTLNRKRPKSLWKFLSTARNVGSGNDKISYRGIRDTDGELKKIIGERAEAPGLIAKDEANAKRSRAYDMDQAIIAAVEEGYFSADAVPTIAEFLEILRSDIDGTAKLYARDDIPDVQEIADAEKWEAWFDQNDIDIQADVATLRAKLPLVLTGQGETAIGPDEAAEVFNGVIGKPAFPTGFDLLNALKQGPLRNKLIRDLTQQRMIERNGDVFRDGSIMQEAEAYARNEVLHRQFEIELEALAEAAGKGTAGALAKQTAIENLRSKQVREVLNYNQWLTLERRWAEKAIKEKDPAKAAEYARFRLINSYMYSEGKKLAEKIEKTRKHLLDYGAKTKQTRLFAAGKEYRETMNGLLDDYQFRNETKKGENQRAARSAWIKAQMAAIDPYSAYQDNTKSDAEKQAEAAEALEKSRTLAGLAEGVDAKGYKSLTVDELLAVRDEADMIWKMATMADQLLKQGERRKLSLAAGDVAAEVVANQPNEKPPEPIETDGPGEGVKRSVLKYFAMHRTLQSLARQFAGGKDGGKFWSYIVKPLNAAYARLSTLRKQMGDDMKGLFSSYTEDEQKRMFRDRRTFDFRQAGGPRITLSKQGRLAFALNWGNDKNRRRLMDSLGLDEAMVGQVLNTLDKRDWDFVQKTWDYLDTWFPEANRVHEAVHGAPMDKEAPLEIATKFGVYRGGYYPIKFDPKLSSRTGQRQMEADAKSFTGQVGARNEPSFAKKRTKGKVTLPLRLSVLDVIASHLDQVATSIATEEALFDAGRIVKQPVVEAAIVGRHGREVYNTIVSTLVTTKFGLEGASGILAHLRNGATVVGLGWKVSTALLQPLGISNSIVRVGGYWIARGYAAMGSDAVTIRRRATWATEKSEFMRNRRQANSPEMAALRKQMKAGVVDLRIPGLGMTKKGLDAIKDNAFAMMANVQFYSVDVPTWYGALLKARAAGFSEADAIAEADQAVIDAQGGGELHQTSAMQTGAGTRYAAALRLLTNFMSYMITTYNLTTQRVRNARTPGQIAALAFDMAIMLAVPVAGKMAIDAWTKGGDDDDEDLLEKYAREQVAFIFSPFVGISQIAGTARGEDAFGYRGPAGLGIFAEATNAGKAAAEADFDESFWRPANKAAGMIFHYPASQIDASIRGAKAYFDGETENPAAFLVGPPPAN